MKKISLFFCIFLLFASCEVNTTRSVERKKQRILKQFPELSERIRDTVVTFSKDTVFVLQEHTFRDTIKNFDKLIVEKPIYVGDSLVRVKLVKTSDNSVLVEIQRLQDSLKAKKSSTVIHQTIVKENPNTKEKSLPLFIPFLTLILIFVSFVVITFYLERKRAKERK